MVLEPSLCDVPVLRKCARKNNNNKNNNNKNNEKNNRTATASLEFDLVTKRTRSGSSPSQRSMRLSTVVSYSVIYQ